MRQLTNRWCNQGNQCKAKDTGPLLPKLQRWPRNPVSRNRLETEAIGQTDVCLSLPSENKAKPSAIGINNNKNNDSNSPLPPPLSTSQPPFFSIMSHADHIKKTKKKPKRERERERERKKFGRCSKRMEKTPLFHLMSVSFFEKCEWATFDCRRTLDTFASLSLSLSPSPPSPSLSAAVIQSVIEHSADDFYPAPNEAKKKHNSWCQSSGRDRECACDFPDWAKGWLVKKNHFKIKKKKLFPVKYWSDADGRLLKQRTQIFNRFKTSPKLCPKSKKTSKKKQKAATEDLESNPLPFGVDCGCHGVVVDRTMTVSGLATTTTTTNTNPRPLRMGRRKQNCPQKTGLTSNNDGKLLLMMAFYAVDN